MTTACHGGGIDAELLVPTTRTVPAAGEPAGQGPGRGIRWFVTGFLAVVLGSGLIGVEAWPLTGWKLYSRVRHGDFWGWHVLAVDPDGTERHVDLRAATAAFHGVTHLLHDLERLPDGERQAICRGLLEEARRQYPDAAGVALDRVLGRIPTDPDRPPPPPSRRIRVDQCGGD